MKPFLTKFRSGGAAGQLTVWPPHAQAPATTRQQGHIVDEGALASGSAPIGRAPVDAELDPVPNEAAEGVFHAPVVIRQEMRPDIIA